MMPRVHPIPAPTLADTLCQSLGNACAVAAATVGARAVRLHLAAAFSDRAALFAGVGLVPNDVAQTAALVAARDLAAQVDGVPGLRALRGRDGHATDHVDLCLEVTLPAGTPTALIELCDVAPGWTARHRMIALEGVARLAALQVAALAEGPALLARPMLALVDALEEFDGSSVSHAFRALLRVLAGESPSRVELTALRIAGLADAPQWSLAQPEVALSDAARGVLDRAGLGHAACTACAGPQEPVPVSAPVPAPLADMPALSVQPFACLRLVERSFDIAEDPATGRLLFRATGAPGDWMRLSHRAADGWTAVATEMLGAAFDTLREFSKMHVIRRRDLPTTEIAEAYELTGTIWWLRRAPGGTEACLDGGPWVPVETGPAQTDKERATAALFTLAPDMTDSLADPARDWAQRMAQTVQVTPIISMAAE